MAPNSAVTRDEVAARVAQSQAVWKAGVRSGNNCLTVTEFNAWVINDGSLADSNRLITLAEFDASKRVHAKIINNTGTKLEITAFDGNNSVNDLASLAQGATRTLPIDTARVDYSYASNTQGGGSAITGTITVTPGQTYTVNNTGNGSSSGGVTQPD
ncbi:hypothetical protein IHN63_00220 [Deinococcus sp. 6YEL10]|uniref:hypothetical protein n=1 Tax=Deinococcus sp. 6YEL10 TaxID=2745870 RepID=UPI001E522FC9|nr:hypothetical protein [Deinococcus sp. 6YEL10]MCD0159723.1 hypothetical protein [Deinococcus sp. 6YEL10]